MQNFPANAEGGRASLFNTCMEWLLCTVVDQSRCRTCVSNASVTSFVCTDDVAVLATVLEFLVMALETLEEGKP